MARTIHTGEGAATPPDTDVEATSEVQDQASAEQNDAEARYTDAEILGRSYPVRMRILAQGKNSLRAAWEGVVADFHNLRENPGMLKDTLLHAIAKRRHESADRKLQEVKERGSDRLVDRRQRKVDTRQAKMLTRKDKLDERLDRMSRRELSVVDNYNARHYETITHYKQKKERALASKALREQLRTEGAGWRERRAITKEVLAGLPKEQMNRLGAAAVNAEVSRRAGKKQEKVEARHEKKLSKTQERIASAEGRAKQYAREAKHADETVEAIETRDLPEAESKVKELRDELDAMAEDDPSRVYVQTLLQEAEDKVAIYTERELPYWRSVAEKSRQKVVDMEGLAFRMRREAEDRTKAHEAAAGKTSEARDLSRSDQESVTREVAEALRIPHQDTNQEGDKNDTTDQAAA